MINDSDPNKPDSIIESALSRYASAEPLAGIEQRVLNRIAAADAGCRTSKILAWALACPILIALVPLAIAVWTPAVIQPARTDFASLPHLPPPPNALMIGRPAAPRRPQPIARRRLESPISREERTLLALAGSQPVEIQQLFAAMQQRNEAPVAIDEIEITPLEITEVQ